MFTLWQNSSDSLCVIRLFTPTVFFNLKGIFLKFVCFERIKRILIDQNG